MDELYFSYYRLQTRREVLEAEAVKAAVDGDPWASPDEVEARWADPDWEAPLDPEQRGEDNE